MIAHPMPIHIAHGSDCIERHCHPVHKNKDVDRHMVHIIAVFLVLSVEGNQEDQEKFSSPSSWGYMELMAHLRTHTYLMEIHQEAEGEP